MFSLPQLLALATKLRAPFLKMLLLLAVMGTR
jgi:hypothetical protein